MKTQSVLFASAIMLIGTLPFAVRTADATPADAKTEQAAPAKAMKPHSHMEEKTGIPAKVAGKEPKKANVALDKSKHSHPRDAK